MTLLNFKTQNSPRCSQCGSILILVSEKKEKIGEYSSLVTLKTYRCSNDECQKEIDRKTQSRKKLQRQQDLAKQKRISAKKGLRINKRKILR